MGEKRRGKTTMRELKTHSILPHTVNVNQQPALIHTPCGRAFPLDSSRIVTDSIPACKICLSSHLNEQIIRHILKTATIYAIRNHTHPYRKPIKRVPFTYTDIAGKNFVVYLDLIKTGFALFIENVVGGFSYDKNPSTKKIKRDLIKRFLRVSEFQNL